MNVAPPASEPGYCLAVLERQASRRSAGIPTLSVLVGPLGACRRAWGQWADTTGRKALVASGSGFPLAEWACAVDEQIDLPAAAIRLLAWRAERDSDELLASWRNKSIADREWFWSTLPPGADDELLRALTMGPEKTSWSGLGEPLLPLMVRLAPAARWPGVLFVPGPTDDLVTLAQAAAQRAERVPAVPLAIAVTPPAWNTYLATAPESRVKALLREGELVVPLVEAATLARTLTEAGAGGSAVAALLATGADAALVASAVQAAEATRTPPRTPEDDDRARSKAERFLFEFLAALPETAGRFELNAALDFRFGPRPAEVDLLCRSPRIALEIDGYYHFLDPAGYRRDRTKDWELQRRGYLVLRFLAEDVIPHLESIRDRILDALAEAPHGGTT